MRLLPGLALPAAWLLWALLTWAGLEPRVDRALGDALLRATAPAASASSAQPASVIVDIDDASLRAMREPLGDWPYSREVYALMLDYLRQAGASLVVMDIVFAGPRDGDARFAAALAAPPPTVLAAAGLVQPPAAVELASASPVEQQALGRLAQDGAVGQPWAGLTAPSEALLQALVVPGSLGVVTAALDADGVLRALPLLHRVQGRVLPSLALAARLRAQGQARWTLAAGELAAGALHWPVDELGRVRLRLPPDGGAHPRVSWQRLMRAALGEQEDGELAALLAGRTVFVGSSAFFADEVMTPQGRLGGTQLNASVFDALAPGQARALAVQGAGVVALSLALWALAALPLLWRRLLPATLGALTGMVVLAVASVHGGYLPWLGPAVYALVLGVLALMLQRQREARELARRLTRDRELAEAASQAKTELLAQVSHEMRTPMNAVLGFSDILARAPLKPELAHYVELLGHAGRQVFALINDLLDRSRLEGGRLQLAVHSFNLVDLVELQVELQRTRAQSQGLWLRVFTRSGGTDWVRGDAQRVAQIVANLVGNAIKFTRQGGVTVELSREPDGRVLLSVQDTGIGIEPAQLQRIFEPFAQAHAGIAGEFGGTGLGLAISRSLAQLMGGDITVQSQPGAGSRFEVRLDLPVADTLPAGHDGHEPERLAPTRPLRLLLAEDNDVNALVIDAMLAPLGHRITRVRDGEQALQVLSTGGFDLVLMDMLMPGLDGLEATRRWRAREQAEGRSRTPIVALTAQAFLSEVKQSLEVGCDTHLTKPISLAALLQALAKYAKPD